MRIAREEAGLGWTVEGGEGNGRGRGKRRELEDVGTWDVESKED